MGIYEKTRKNNTKTRKKTEQTPTSMHANNEYNNE